MISEYYYLLGAQEGKKKDLADGDKDLNEYNQIYSAKPCTDQEAPLGTYHFTGFNRYLTYTAI